MSNKRVNNSKIIKIATGLISMSVISCFLCSCTGKNDNPMQTEKANIIISTPGAITPDKDSNTLPENTGDLPMDTDGNETNIPIVEPTSEPVPDSEAPVLYGVVDKQFYVGEGISYLDGVYAVDNVDDEVEINVDRKNVDTKKAGVYEVSYTATDKAGNTTTQNAFVTLSNTLVSEEKLNAEVEKVLSEITTEDMTMADKIWAIYKYVNTNIYYINSSNKDDWRAEAYRGITEGCGDCFTYYSVCNALLNGIGAEIMSVRRIETAATRHYWHMVNIGNGWYHFDASFHTDRYVSFMLTDAQLQEYTDKRGRDYYAYDKTKYPSSANTEYEWERVI